MQDRTIKGFNQQNLSFANDTYCRMNLCHPFFHPSMLPFFHLPPIHPFMYSSTSPLFHPSILPSTLPFPHFCMEGRRAATTGNAARQLTEPAYSP